MDQKPNYEQQEWINRAASKLFDQILWKIEEQEVSSIDECKAALQECQWNEDAAIGIGMKERVDLIQQFGPDFGLDLGDVKLDNLDLKIETLTIAVLHHLAEQQTAKHLDELRDIMEDHDLAFENIVEDNSYKGFVHRSERYPAEGCSIYEYRAIEALDQAVDVWKVFLGESCLVHFQVEPKRD